MKNFSIPSPKFARGDLVALGAPGDRTLADLLADADRLAIAIADRAKANASANTRAAPDANEVLLICADRYHFAVGLLAIWKAGLCAALPPNAQPETIRTLAAHPSIRLLVHDTDSGEGFDLRTALLDRSPIAEATPLDLSPDRPIATLYTSGSTGEHKRCPKTALELIGEASAHVASFHFAPGERFVATVPGHHIYGLLWGVLVPLLSGGAFARQTPFYPDAVAARLAELKATCLVSVPAHLRGIAELDTLPSVRRITSSSAALPTETAQQIFERFGLRVTELYGSSETGGIAFREEPGAPHTPLSGVSVTADADGRLLLDSPFLTPGTPRPMPCDDRVEILADGRFLLRGRLDGVVKVGGKRVSLSEIDRHLLQVPGVKDAACLAREVDSGRGAEIWAAVVAPALTAAQIRTRLRDWIDPVAIPRRLLLVPALPREENGKLLRSKLSALFEAPGAIEGNDANEMNDAIEGDIPRFANAPVELVPTRERPLPDGSGYVLSFHIPEDYFYFRGHFDGLPILPGVVQLELIVRRQISRLWPDLATGLRRVAQLKFKRTIEPGTDLFLTLRRDPSSVSSAAHTSCSKVRFEIADASDSGVCSQGQFCFELESKRLSPTSP
ncbi:MAG: AMP-binding protein [Myxococcales bacterium]|jgi:4-coumarate--CoA ligase (photoactive yellow protein activation family)|nr:AMP-binding protein [Myxococcales bacterium]